MDMRESLVCTLRRIDYSDMVDKILKSCIRIAFPTISSDSTSNFHIFS